MTLFMTFITDDSHYIDMYLTLISSGPLRKSNSR